MAEWLDDAEFWLPSEFLADEDFLLDRKNSFFPRRAPGSGLSSPVDSLEADSDEEADLLAELSRKMAHSTLLDEGLNLKAADSKVRLLSGSPQSTLRPGWDLLCEAAGEVARLRLAEQLYGLSRGSKGGGEALYAAPAGRAVPVKSHISNNGGFNYSRHQNPLSSHQQLVANQIQQLKQQQAMLKHQQQHRAMIKQEQQHQSMIKQEEQQQQVQRRRHGAAWGLNAKPNAGPYHAVRKPAASGAGRQVVAPAALAWPSLQRQNGAGMKAVFLGNPPSAKRERAGTGVFLPRGAGSGPEPRKRTACSTVLLPDKVVRALNLNLESVGSQPQTQYRLNGCLASDIDCVWNHLRGNGVRAQTQNQNNHSQAAPLNHEIRLPQEWTY